MPEVKIYLTPDSSPCQDAIRHLEQRGLLVNKLDVSVDIFAMASLIVKTGDRKVPAIGINDSFVVGYDPAKIDELLVRQGVIQP